MDDQETLAWVRVQLVESLSEIQRQSGRETPLLGDESVPMDDLPGFDSVNGVEVEVLLSERLGLDVKHLPFADAEDRNLTVREIAHAVVIQHRKQLGPKARTRGLEDGERPSSGGQP